MSQPFKLYRLQQIDSQLDRARSRMGEIELALGEETALHQAQEQLAVAEVKLRETSKILRRAEQVVQTQRIKIEQTEASLYSGKVRNPKELQDLQNESAALRRFQNVLEDRQLEAMLAVEEAEEKHQQAVRNLEAVRTQVAQQNASLTEEQTVLLKEVKRLEGERLAAASGIPEDDLRMYEQLRRQRSGMAVAKVTDKACGACGSTLTASLLQAAHSPNQITWCASCGRILYAG